MPPTPAIIVVPLVLARARHLGRLLGLERRESSSSSSGGRHFGLTYVAVLFVGGGGAAAAAASVLPTQARGSSSKGGGRLGKGGGGLLGADQEGGGDGEEEGDDEDDFAEAGDFHGLAVGWWCLVLCWLWEVVRWGEEGRKMSRVFVWARKEGGRVGVACSRA